MCKSFIENTLIARHSFEKYKSFEKSTNSFSTSHLFNKSKLSSEQPNITD